MASLDLYKDMLKKEEAYARAQDVADQAANALEEAKTNLENHLIQINKRLAEPVPDKNFEAAYNELSKEYMLLLNILAQQNDLDIEINGDA